jgi:hypothetical protein
MHSSLASCTIGLSNNEEHTTTSYAKNNTKELDLGVMHDRILYEIGMHIKKRMIDSAIISSAEREPEATSSERLVQFIHYILYITF